jgi:hypothetical protein
MMNDPQQLPTILPEATVTYDKAEPLTTLLIAPIAIAVGCLFASPIAACALRIFLWTAGL